MAKPSGKREGERRGGTGGPAPRRGAGEGAWTGDQRTVASGNHASREEVTGPESPVMGPKTLPGSECDSGKAPGERKPPLKRRVETHTAGAQGSSPPVPWRWRSRAARIRGCDRPRRAGPTRAKQGARTGGSPRSPSG